MFGEFSIYRETFNKINKLLGSEQIGSLLFNETERVIEIRVER